jgi:CrcB protein
MLNALAVFLGGGLGSLCRYGLTFFWQETTMPVATLVANILACFLLGFLTSYWTKNNGVSDVWKLLFGTGFCGGFSTFSTFSKEVVLLQEEHIWIQAVYLVLSIALGVFAVCLGIMVAQWGENL